MNLAEDLMSNLRAYDFFLAVALFGAHPDNILLVSPASGMVQAHHDAFDVLHVYSYLRGIWYFVWNTFHSYCKYG